MLLTRDRQGPQGKLRPPKAQDKSTSYIWESYISIVKLAILELGPSSQFRSSQRPPPQQSPVMFIPFLITQLKTMSYEMVAQAEVVRRKQTPTVPMSDCRMCQKNDW